MLIAVCAVAFVIGVVLALCTVIPVFALVVVVFAVVFAISVVLAILHRSICFSCSYCSLGCNI